MIDVQILLIVLGVFLLVFLGILVKKLSKVKVWIDSRMKENQPLIRTCYLQKGEEGTAAEIYRAGAFGKPAVGIVKVDEKSTRNRAYVEVLMSDMNDDAEKPHYRRAGYISFDQDTSVDQYGYIYKQIKGKKEKEVVGYLARPSKPNEPTIYGERSWKTLWLKCVLNAYAGIPEGAEEQLPAVNQSVQGVENLYLNNPKKKAEEEVVIPEEPKPEVVIQEEPKPEPVVAPEVPAPAEPADPFAALSPEEKARLDKVRAQKSTIIEALLNKMVRVEGGTFVMGNDPQPNVEDNESPKHQVTLSTYSISAYPITQEQWVAVMGYNPSDCQENIHYPVAPVSWYECQEFVLRLSYITGIDFSLPTEAQWEFAARGGNKSKGYQYAGSNTFSEVGWTDHKHEVGTKKPNELGLYDMSGLVREWCSDLWAHYTDQAQTDPMGIAENSPEVIRDSQGRAFRAVRSPSGNETVTNRKGEIPELDKDFKSYGLRVVAKNMPERPTPAPIAKPLEKRPPQKPLAVCSFWGFHSSKKDVLPAEARAAAFALLQRYARHQKQAEYASEQPYGWKDTALLSAVIYTVLFIIVYLINTGVFQMPLLGKSWTSTSVFVGYYYVIWAIVRFIKIDAIENANSFQPILDLFNKNLGMKFMNLAIIALCSVAMVFTYFYYDYDFMPLLVVISTGVGINMSLPAANRRWKVQASFLDDLSDSEDEEEEETEPQNPQGDISRSYEWDLDQTYDSQRQVHGSLTLYFKATDIRDVRHMNPFFAQRKDHSDKENILFMFHFLKKYKKTFLARTNYVAYTINKIADKYHFSPMDKLQFTLDFVQEPNIAFQENADNKTINFYDDYIRFPDETLYDKCGDSNSKSLLATMLFHLMEKNVLYLISRKHQHSAVGVEVKENELMDGWYGDASKKDEIAVKYEDRYYIFCETTGDQFRLGAQVSGMSLDEFDEKIFLPVCDDDDEVDRVSDEDTEDTVASRLYTWELSSVFGNKLSGIMLLEMSSNEIETLRTINPFLTYGQDNRTYPENVLSIFQFLKSNPARMTNVRQVADYIRTTVRNAGYPELDVLQFALNFVQEPNITYVLDEKSAPIEFAKEYMRFPDEVLYDKQGDCDCKSALTAALFLALGYKVVFLLSQKLKHAAIGVECKDAAWLSGLSNADDVAMEHNGVQYLYCETTGAGFHVGQIKENESIKDFETILELAL